MIHNTVRAWYATCKMQHATKPSSTFFEIAVYLNVNEKETVYPNMTFLIIGVDEGWSNSFCSLYLRKLARLSRVCALVINNATLTIIC